MQPIDALSHSWLSEGSVGRSFEPSRIQEVLSAVSAANEQILVALRESAFRNEPTFPLPALVRRRFIEISRAQLREVATCGALLVDVRFADTGSWRSIAHASEEPADDRRGRVASDQCVALAYGVLAVVWYVVQATPVAAGLLLGMSTAVVKEFERLGVGKLGFVARSHPNWVQPRWSDRADVWMDILQTDGRLPPALRRCLRAAAARSPGLLSIIERST